MPPRPSIRSKDSARPLSAIYIGNQSHASNNNNHNGHAASGPITASVGAPSPVPDLPEPASPVGSVGSGLPSPPATNSTGSGSTGDPASIAVRRPAPPMYSAHTPTSSSDSSGTVPSDSRSSSRLSWKQDDQDDDQTMRLRINNETMLQRAHKLLQRNKLELDKSRHSRHSLPDPAQVLSGSETEREGDSFHSTSSSSNSYTRVRLSSAPTSPHKARTRKRASVASMSYDDHNDHNEFYDERMGRGDTEHYEVGTARDRIQDTLRDDRPSTRAPPVNLNSARKTPLGPARRRSALPREFREGSAAADEHKISTNLADLSPQTPYRPTSTASTSTATTATSTTTTSTMTTLGRRSTLRSARGLSDDYRHSPTYSSRDLPSIRSVSRNTPTTPAPPASAPSSKTMHTFNDSVTITRSNTIGRQTQPGAVQRERRQSLRAGSAESALGGAGRSLVGEGLRAAGLSRRVSVGRERERTISESSSGALGRGESSMTSSGDFTSDRASLVSAEGRSQSRVGTRAEGGADVFKEGERRRVDWSPDTTESLTRPRRMLGELGARGAPPRASTSMAHYSYTARIRHQAQSDDENEDDPDGTRDDRGLRPYKSAHPLTTSREASLTQREQSLLERERELGRREREFDRAGSALGRYQGGGNTVSATPAPTPYSTIRDRDRYPSPFGSTRRATLTASTGQQPQQGGQQHQAQSEHARLMIESLSMFESQLSKLAPSLGQGANHAEMLSRNAQALVLSAERLNGMLRTGNSKSLDAQIEAEVEGDGPGGGRSLVEVWRKIGGEYREGLRVSDELVRAVTGLLLGVGRVMKEYVHLGSGGGSTGGAVESPGLGGMSRSPVVHGRSISLSDENLRGRGSSSPDFGAGTSSTGSGGGGSKESRRSWEPGQSAAAGAGARAGGSSSASVSTGAGSREEALRRLAGVRSDSPLARASPAFLAARELDRLETASPAMGGSGSGLPRVNIPAARRLFAPSQQREMALVASASSGQDADYDPSPTPISRTRVFDRAELGVPPLSQQGHSPVQSLQSLEDVNLERSRTLSRAAAPQPGVALETPLRRNITISAGDSNRISRDKHERRKISVTSIATIRASVTSGGASTSSMSSGGAGVAGPPAFSALTTPSGATTAVTVDGTMGMGMKMESGPERTGGEVYSMTPSAQPTFSRPEGMTSVTGLQQQLEGYRKRVEGEVVESGPGDGSSDDANGKGRNGARGSLSSALITPESEREIRRKTLGSRFGQKMSLDSVAGSVGSELSEGERGGKGVAVVDLSVNAADRSAAVTLGGGGSGKRERRRTVTDIWPRS